MLLHRLWDFSEVMEILLLGGTISLKNRKAQIHYQNCIHCFCCHEMCPQHVIDIRRFSLFRF